MWALIEDSKVIEITNLDPAGRFHPSLVWLACTPEVAVGWNFGNGRFTPPEEEKIITPLSCSPAQGLVALFALQRITEEDVLEAIGQIADPVQQYTARIGYQRATSWERTSPTMQTMAQLLQLSESDLDELFTHASGVNL